MLAKASRTTVLYLQGVACRLRAFHFFRSNFKFRQLGLLFTVDRVGVGGGVRIDHKFNRLVVQVCPNLVTFFTHDCLDIRRVVIKPTQVVRDQVMLLAPFTPDQNNALRVRIAREGARLLGVAD